jgi:hypothetical protein
MRQPSEYDTLAFEKIEFGLVDLPVVNEHVEEVVHQEDAVGLNAGCVEQHRLRWTIERVGEELGLNHCGTLVHILAHQNVP